MCTHDSCHVYRVHRAKYEQHRGHYRSDADISPDGRDREYRLCGIAVYDMAHVRHAFMKLGISGGIRVLVSTVYFMLSPITAPSNELLARTLADDLGCAYRRVRRPCGYHRHNKGRKGKQCDPGCGDRHGPDAAVMYRWLWNCPSFLEIFRRCHVFIFINCFFIGMAAVVVLKNHACDLQEGNFR